jgi:hypothetical protein
MLHLEAFGDDLEFGAVQRFVGAGLVRCGVSHIAYERWLALCRPVLADHEQAPPADTAKFTDLMRIR